MLRHVNGFFTSTQRRVSHCSLPAVVRADSAQMTFPIVEIAKAWRTWRLRHRDPSVLGEMVRGCAAAESAHCKAFSAAGCRVL